MNNDRGWYWKHLHQRWGTEGPRWFHFVTSATTQAQRSAWWYVFRTAGKPPRIPSRRAIMKSIANRALTTPWMREPTRWG